MVFFNSMIIVMFLKPGYNYLIEWIVPLKLCQDLLTINPGENLPYKNSSIFLHQLLTLKGILKHQLFRKS